jgi:hypothetical protein
VPTAVIVMLGVGCQKSGSGTPVFAFTFCSKTKQ